MIVVGEGVLAVLAWPTDAPFSLFGAATLLPVAICAAAVLLDIAKRRSLPSSQGFPLGRFEVPVLLIRGGGPSDRPLPDLASIDAELDATAAAGSHADSTATEVPGPRNEGRR